MKLLAEQSQLPRLGQLVRYDYAERSCSEGDNDSCRCRVCKERPWTSSNGQSSSSSSSRRRPYTRGRTDDPMTTNMLRRSALKHLPSIVAVVFLSFVIPAHARRAPLIGTASEWDILQEFYDATNGPNWKESANWNTSASFCEWYGIVCTSDTDTPSVEKISMKANNLQGTIPSSLWTLPSLVNVVLTSNSISSLNIQDIDAAAVTAGKVSPIKELLVAQNQISSIDNLSVFADTLQHVNLNRNQVSQPLPEDIYDCVNLQSLYIAFNRISGSLSTRIGKLARLGELYAFENSLTGQLPSELGNLVSCQILGLGNNYFTGTLPTEMEGMINLRDLSIHHSEQQQQRDNEQSTGNAPVGADLDNNKGLHGPLLSFGDLPYLTLLFLDGNKLTGTIPTDFLRHNENLKEPISVGLANNMLSGTVPKALERFEHLSIGLVGNDITSIPSELCALGGWMGGLVESYGCDAILCPVGTYQRLEGRAVRDEAQCENCPGSVKMGATTCESLDGGSGGSNTDDILEPFEILVEIYRHLNGPQWTIHDGWEMINTIIDEGYTKEQIRQMDVAYCSGWYGVVCNGHHGEDRNIIELSLPKNALFGTVPSALLQLSQLKNLDLSNNNVVLNNLISAADNQTPLRSLVLSNIQMGSLEGIDKLQSTLELLYIDGCNIVGPIPSELFQLTKLRLLHLQHASFTGAIPTLLGQLSQLELLNVYGNSLTGSLPSEVGKLTMLEILDLSENQLTGTIPDELMTECINLTSLSIHHTNSDKGLSGKLPAFQDFKHIRELNLQDNDFSGSIPSEFLSGAIEKSLSLLVSLGGNRISGTLPLSLDEFSLLTINLENNHITGLPATLCENDAWMHGEVGSVAGTGINKCDAILCPPGSWAENGKATSTSPCQNCLSDSNLYGQTSCGQSAGNLERQILDKLFSATGGRYWNSTHDNWVQPGVPICQREGISCLGTGDGNDDDNSSVDILHMIDFGLRGTIPSEIWQLPHVRTLTFTGNQVDISFEGIEQASNLRVFKCSKCQLRSLDGLRNAPSKLTEIHLAENQFNGPIPDDIFQLTNVRKIFLNNNHFTGSLSEDLGKLTSMKELHLHSNDMTGTLPTEVGLMESLTVLDLSDNKFSGNLPTQLEELLYLSKLLMARQSSSDKFQGPLPAFSNNEELIQIDLSQNRLSGPLPINFLINVEPTETINVDLSSNSFTGGVPSQWSRMDLLNIDLSDNYITELPDLICKQGEWNNGQVGILNTCDAILCAPGTFSIYGRKVTVNGQCEPCEGSVAGAPYYGSTKCQDPQLLGELQVLKKFYQAANGTKWLVQENWMSDLPACTWYGITCNDNNYIEEISMETNLIQGSGLDDVSGILRLEHLKYLDLKDNDIQLDLTQIVTGSKLEFLRLSGTNTRDIKGISNAESLTALHLTNNEIRELPAEIFSLTNLESLFLSFNSIEGPISSRFSELTSLRELYMFGNYLTGRIPKSLGTVSSLVEIVFSMNLLSGEIPNELGSMPKLEQLSLYDQQGFDLITGPLPSFSQAPRLWYLDVSNNNLKGPIPDDFMINSVYTDDTVTVFLHDNDLTGTVPSTLSQFQQLDLRLAGNQINKIPSELCNIGGWMTGNAAQVGNCSAILCPRGTFNDYGFMIPSKPCLPCKHLNDNPFLGHNHCENFSAEGLILKQLYDAAGGEFWKRSDGWVSDLPLCSWEGVLCEDDDKQSISGITSISLDGNGLEGTLPTEIWTLPSLRELDLKNNPKLKVTFDGLEHAKNLETLYLSEVLISSTQGISKAKGLRVLHLTGNELNSQFPEEIFDLSETLQSLYIAYNLFNGPIPTRIGELSRLEALYAFENDFVSTIPTEIALLSSLRVLVLSENIIYGTLPSELSKMPRLEVLSIFRDTKSGPRLTGTLPALERLPKLSYLFLNNNELGGTIPSNFLAGSLAVREVHLESNMLTGTVSSTFNSIDEMYLHLQGNRIEAMSEAYCKKTDWMGGAVQEYGCNAIMCSPGQAGEMGRSVNASVLCKDCPDPSLVPYYGSVSCTGPANDREILMNLYKELDGDSWRRNDYWNSNVNVCDWYGIACVNGEIVEINLGSNNLRGLPSPDLFNLPQLRILWLNSNPMTFSFENIASARKLEDLRLDGTQTHSVHGIGAGQSLVNVDVGFTSIRGTFPAEIIGLANLRTLSMRGNALTGPLPNGLDDMRYLTVLALDSNKLTGTLPAFDNMHFLSTIYLQNNTLSGSIPRRFLDRINSEDSVVVNLANNQLTGVVPEELSRFDDMHLYLRNNWLLGLPISICNKAGWLGGSVGSIGCDAILCRPGTANQYGRETEGTTCINCLAAQYYGSTACMSDSSLGMPTTGMSVWGAIRWVVGSSAVATLFTLTLLWE